MTAFVVKIIAIVCMLIDHVGAIFPGTPDWFRLIGRIAFPIYAYFIAEGCIHTKNIEKYLLRLGIFALISQVPFALAFNYPGLSAVTVSAMLASVSFLHFTNVFYSLFLAVACITIYIKLQRKSNKLFAFIPLVIMIPIAFLLWREYLLPVIAIYSAAVLVLSLSLPEDRSGKEPGIGDKILALIPALPVVLLGDLLSTDYGTFAVVLILFLYLVQTKVMRLAVLALGVAFLYGVAHSSLIHMGFAFIAVVILYFYNGRRGISMKWFFYWFYPVHLAVLAGIWMLLYLPPVI